MLIKQRANFVNFFKSVPKYSVEKEIWGRYKEYENQ